MISITVYYLYFVNLDFNIKITGVFILLFESYILFHLKNKLTKKSIQSYVVPKIRKIVLVVQDEQGEKQWLCENAKAFLIGKGTDTQSVDIDLSDLQCNAYISQEHAVMNYANGYWYIEDLNSTNGVGLKKYDDEYAYKLKPFTSYKLDQGDVIYISKAKLLLRE
jgi:pSer/pThr/pTyr-binding forkhead associated (FHA) protein